MDNLPIFIGIFLYVLGFTNGFLHSHLISLRKRNSDIQMTMIRHKK